ncbi:hypothetical protein BT69DRAFT_1288174, partial [Atractiella rhizophila]
MVVEDEEEEVKRLLDGEKVDEKLTIIDDTDGKEDDKKTQHGLELVEVQIDERMWLGFERRGDVWVWKTFCNI